MKTQDPTELLKALRQHEELKHQQHTDKRSEPRYIPLTPEVSVQFEHPGGSVSNNEALLVNISKNGACIATRSFLHNNTKLTLKLIMNGGDPVSITATVKWCNYFSAQSHESGIAFDQPIDPRHFVSTDQWNQPEETNPFDWTTPRDSLIISSDQIAFNTLQKLLKTANVSATQASSTQHTIQLLQPNTYDAIFLTAHPDPIITETDISTLQAHGYTGPILIETPTADSRSNAFINAGAAAVLQQPIQLAPLLTKLQDSIQRAQRNHTNHTPIYSTLTQDQCDDKSLQGYIVALAKSSSQLADAINNNDLQTALSVCNALLTSGSGFGYPLISSTAMVVTKALNASGSCKESSIEIRSLIKLIARIHTRQAA
ncbi:MAG: PilZ domain-containing protein [Phycisphaerales bacterium]